MVQSSVKSNWQSVTSGVLLGLLSNNNYTVILSVFINDIGWGDRVHSQQASGQYQTGQSLKDRVAIQRDIGQLEKWADGNLMKMTKSKCQVLLLGRYNPMHQYRQRSNQLASSFAKKDLGILGCCVQFWGQNRHLSADLEQVHQRTTKVIGGWSP